MNPLTETEARQVLERLTVGCDDMIGALRELMTSKKDIAGQIHSLRKLGKVLRGGIVLLGQDKSAYRGLQAVGRLLSERRDAVSRRSTWTKLEKKPKSLTSRAIVGLLNQQVTSAGRKPPKAAVLWCIQRVESTKTVLMELPIEGLTERVEDGLSTLWKKLRKRTQKLDNADEEAFHDLRKSLKAYLGALKFLPEEHRIVGPHMHHLADILGDENDLATLSYWLENHGFTYKLEPDVWKKITKARNKHQAHAREQLAELEKDFD